MKKFGFVGAGKMAGAIVRGMLDSIGAENIACVCGDDNTGRELSEQTGIALAASHAELFGNSQTVVLACKPQQLAEVAKTADSANFPLLISILAGTNLSRLRQCFKGVGNIVRVMPNMPAQISQGISCYASEKPLSETEKKTFVSDPTAIGEFMEVPEAKLDAVTALSGSGPGYLFEFAAAMIEGALKLGFTRDEAKKLVEKTLLGSAMLLTKSSLSADELCKAVSSPGGTTLAALNVFAKNNFREMVENALVAARDRSAELSKF